MRITRLDLLRYGRFTDVALDLSPHNPDLHIIFGPNEAGKSTALSAIEDLLFGIHPNSPLNFVHPYGTMRIGALLQKNGESLALRRRKGNKDTLLTPEEAVIASGDAALAPFLGGADRNFFARMFSLDHVRLRQGGREILEAQDEIGQMLFSAGAGIVGLRDRLKTLEKEADGLWASRRAGHRKYYQSEDRLKTADSALREHTVSAGKWHDLRRAYEAARDTFETIEADIEAKSAELRKLTRIRRVYRDVGRYAELTAGIAALGTVVPLAPDALQKLRAAEEDETQATTRIETLAERIDQDRAERDLLTYDEGLQLRAQDVKQLQERRIQVRGEKADLPKRRADLAANEGHLRRLAEELEWVADDIDQLIAGIPARAKVAGVRALLNQRGGLCSEVENGTSALEEAESKLTEIQQELEGMGPPADVSKLAALVSATRTMGDVATRINAAEEEVEEARAKGARSLSTLTPPVADEGTLASVPVPPSDAVQSHRDACRALDERRRACDERTRSAELDLARHEKAHERIARDENAVSPEELVGVREHRDAGWSLIRRQYVDGVAVDEGAIRAFTGNEGDLGRAYETAVSDGDRLADRRFDKAEAAARLAVTSREIAERRELLDGLREEAKALAEERLRMDAAWRELWCEAPFDPLTPDAMLQWIATRATVQDEVNRRTATEHRVAALRREESDAKSLLLEGLAVLGASPAPAADEPLRVVLERCARIQRTHERDAEARRRLEESRRKGAADVERKRAALQKAREQWSLWETRWIEALARLGLHASSEPEAVAAQVNAIDEIREIAVKVNELRYERIGKIERDLAAFDRDVRDLVGAVAQDLVEMPSEEAVLQVEGRLNDAERTRELRNVKEKTIASLEEKTREWEESRRTAREAIGRLEDTAGVHSLEEVRAAIERSDSVRAMQTELSQVAERLAKAGDGLPVSALEDECAADVDQVAAREDALGRELKDRQDLLMAARDGLNDARNSLEAIGGDDAAAKDAAARQEALAEMQRVAEQYVRVRASIILLRWAIDRYRREKQVPILKRAGELFAALTGNSFGALRVDFDDQDRARLIGVRPDGATVAVSGMSAGTADQLYLALRIASVEDYLDRAVPLPFIADDLFINFDDERAAAGLKVLAGLALRTQVLFFTHHRHLVDIARAALDASVPVVPLALGAHETQSSARPSTREAPSK